MVSLFKLGTIILPSAQQRIAEEICAENNLTSTELFCKWEAWALNQQKSTDLPTVDDLQTLATHIRTKAAKAKEISTTPRSRRPSKSHSPLYRPSPTPTRINVDDFFSYLDPADIPSSTADPVDQLPSPSPAADPLDHHTNHTPPHPTSSLTPQKRRAPSPLPQPDFDSPPRKLAAPRAHRTASSAATLPGDDVPDAAYQRRAASGRIEATLTGTHRPTDEPFATSFSLRVLQTAAEDQRYMNDALPTRIEALRARVSSVSSAILTRAEHTRPADATQPLPPCRPEAFFVASPDLVLAAGRVRADDADPDGGAGGGRINAMSAKLESVEGNVVHLDLSRVQGDKARSFFLCPGMVVVVEGVNTNGRTLDVHAIHDNALPSPQYGPCPARDSTAPPFVSVLAAAGPFCTNGNLRFEPLMDLLGVMERTRPHAVLLSGPFVPVKHPLVHGRTIMPFVDILRSRVVQPIQDAMARMRAEGGHVPVVVMQPGLDDACAAVVVPQPALRVDGISDGEKVTFVGNPAVIELGGEMEVAEDGDEGGDVSRTKWRATVGMSALPAIQDMAADCVNWGGDRFEGIAGCMVRQRSMYPVCPGGADVPMDAGLMDGLNVPTFEESGSVDVLVVPSRVKAFAKVVDEGVVAVNPGVVCRGFGGGSYAQVSVPLHRVGEKRELMFNAEHVDVNIVRL